MGHTCLLTPTFHIVSSDPTILQTGTQAGEGMRFAGPSAGRWQSQEQQVCLRGSMSQGLSLYLCWGCPAECEDSQLSPA